MAESERVGNGTERLLSPEQLNDYLHVTNPKIWLLLVAVVLLLGGLLMWSGFATVESYATGEAKAHEGELTVTFDDSAKAAKVQAGMELEVGGERVEIAAVGTDEQGKTIASAHANIPDGSYEIRVGYNTTQVISMLFN